MKRFTQLFQAVDSTTSTNEKVRALAAYFKEEEPANAVWALYLLLGKTRKRLVTSNVLRQVFLQISDMPEWLFKESYSHVGDSAEVIALLLRDTPLQRSSAADIALKDWMETIIPKVKTAESDEEISALVTSWWSALDFTEVFVLNKVLTGAFRIGVSSKLVIRGLAAAFEISEAVLAHRLMGDFQPTVEFYTQLTSPEAAEVAPSQPYPFFLASSLDVDRFKDEPMGDWQAEWKWDGIRAQVIKRAGEVFIWSRGEDLVTQQFPELEEAFQAIPDGYVFDGEIVCWDHERDRPMSFNALQTRLGRKRVSQKLRTESPVCFLAYDLIERAGEDIRELPLRDRRQSLKTIIYQIELPGEKAGKVTSNAQELEKDSGKKSQKKSNSSRSESLRDIIRITNLLEFSTFDDLSQYRAKSREASAEGLVIKALDSPYLVGRKRGYWWKYKVDPMTLDAVLIYAQAGSGKRANLFTDYTFALWNEGELVPFAKAYSGLDHKEIDALDKWIRRHTVERFGPVRSVKPIHVFEIGFEGIAESKRHKSGIAVRFPRILRWRSDKPPEEADTLESAMQLLETYG